LEFFICDMNMV